MKSAIDRPVRSFKKSCNALSSGKYTVLFDNVILLIQIAEDLIVVGPNWLGQANRGAIQLATPRIVQAYENETRSLMNGTKWHRCFYAYRRCGSTSSFWGLIQIGLA